MAEFLEQRKVHAQVVTVGGAVNALYLRSRPSTHDVDFFLENPDSPIHHDLRETARYANRKRTGSLGATWFNNAIQLFVPAHLQKQLFDAAVQQGVMVYSHANLVVYAAPWSYALCGKLNRLCDPEPRPYDIADAVLYLQEHLKASGQSNLSAVQIEQWCELYRKNVRRDVLQRLDEAYRQAYGQGALIWDS